MITLVSSGAKIKDQVAHLLSTLPTSYDGVITAIETLSEDNLTLAHVKIRLLDREVKPRNKSSDTSRKVHTEKTINFARKSNFKNYKIQKNHYHGNNKFQFPKKNPNHANMKCHHCGRKGHAKADCYYFLNQRNNHKDDPIRTAQNIQVIGEMPLSQTPMNNSSRFAFMTGNYERNSKNKDKIFFFLDSGASDHFMNGSELSEIFEILKSPLKISIAKNGAFITATKKGTLSITTNMGEIGEINNVLYCPESPYNLLSVSRLQQAGITIIFNHENVEICRNSKPITKGIQMNN